MEDNMSDTRIHQQEPLVEKEENADELFFQSQINQKQRERINTFLMTPPEENDDKYV